MHSLDGCPQAPCPAPPHGPLADCPSPSPPNRIRRALDPSYRPCKLTAPIPPHRPSDWQCHRQLSIRMQMRSTPRCAPEPAACRTCMRTNMMTTVPKRDPEHYRMQRTDRMHACMHCPHRTHACPPCMGGQPSHICHALYHGPGPTHILAGGEVQCHASAAACISRPPSRSGGAVQSHASAAACVPP